MTDLISRADAIEAVKETKPIVRSTERNWGKMIAEQHSKELVKALKALPSADAVDVAHDIPEYCSWSQTYTNMVQSAMSNASAEAVHKPDYSYEADMVRRLKESRSADAVPQMDHDRDWIIGCIKHDGFIKTDRFDKANQIILDALQTDAIPLEHHRKVLYKTVDQDIEIARLKNRIKELENG